MASAAAPPAAGQPGLQLRQPDRALGAGRHGAGLRHRGARRHRGRDRAPGDRARLPRRRVATLQWVVDAYTLSLAGLLLLGGTLGDRYGRRRVFVIGTVWFAAGVAAVRAGPGRDHAHPGPRPAGGRGRAADARAAWPSCRPPSSRRTGRRAIGAWSGLGGLATAVGPFVGGWLISAVSWRLVFFINLPVAAAVVAIAVRHVPESRAPGETGPLDVPGAITITGALVGITYGLIAASGQGWSSAPVLSSLLGGIVLLAAFIVIESRRAEPDAAARCVLVPPVLRRQRGHVRRLRGAGRHAVPAADRPAGGGRVQPAGLRGRPAAGDRDHAGPVGAVGRAGGEDRAAPADVGRPARHRRRAAAVHAGHRLRQLRDRRAARRPGVRASVWPSTWPR